MRCNLFLLVCFVLGVAYLVESANGDFDGMIDIDEQTPYHRVRRTWATDGDSDEDDEDDDSEVDEASGVQSDSADVSGSGSGEVDIIEATTSATTSATTVPSKDSTTTSTTAAKTEESAERTTEDNFIATETTAEPVFTETIEESEEPVVYENGEEGDTNVFAGGVGEMSTQNTPKVDPVVEKKLLRVLTTEVIAAVVVGAVCAVILIAFLVYRLRKRDEGSYALSDAGFKDTYKPHGDTGKEAFV